MSYNSIKRLLLAITASTTLGANNVKAAAPASRAKVPSRNVVVDSHQNDRDTFVSTYKALCLDFEGDFPAIYWDHGNIALPGGVKMDPKQTITVRKITSLDGSRIPVKSYKKDIKDNMLLMADKGVLPPAYKNKFKIELVQLDAGTLNKSNIPDFGDTSYTNAVYYVPATQRAESHKKAINKHLKMAEDWLGVDRFYSLPIARQVAVVDMLYVLGPEKFKKTKFAKAVAAKDWMGPNAAEPKLTNKQVAMREAFASTKEKNSRRHLARQLLLAWGTDSLMPQNMSMIKKDIASTLPVGEKNLAKYVEAVLTATAEANQQRFIRNAAMKQQGLNK